VPWQLPRIVRKGYLEAKALHKYQSERTVRAYGASAAGVGRLLRNNAGRSAKNGLGVGAGVGEGTGVSVGTGVGMICSQELKIPGRYVCRFGPPVSAATLACAGPAR
jgi:hypothetical protein